MISSRISEAEMMNIGLRRRSCHASDHRLRGLPPPPGLDSPAGAAETPEAVVAGVS
jgi:hypothetical protein